MHIAARVKRSDTGDIPADMASIPGGTFLMGSDRHYPEEAPAHRVSVAPFWIDRTPVTNRQFKRFVVATGYVTVAEVAPDPKDYPGALPHMLKAGSLVFMPPSHTVDLRDWAQWWRFEFGADWRHPFGRGKQRALPRASCGPHRLSGCRSLCRMGGQAAADGSGMGVCRTRRAGWRGVRVGRRTDPRRTAHGKYVARGISRMKNLATDGHPRTSAVTVFPPNAYRRLRHDWERVGVDDGLVLAAPHGKCGKSLLHSGKPTGRRRGRQP